MLAQMTTKDIVAAVRSVVGPGKIALHEPQIRLHETYVRYLENKDVVGYDAINEFQERIAKVCGTEQSLCVSSGTAALHLALMVSGVAPYTEVMVPGLTFVATANAVTYCSAIPHFVDVRGTDLGINPFKLQRYLGRIAEKRSDGTFNKLTGRKISALIAVDLLGVPCDMDAIKQEAGRWGLPVIEDAAEALGSRYKDNKPCGSNGFVGILSFNNNKIVTTNGGGALLTNDPYVQARAWELATTARIGHPWRMGDHSSIAWNYRMGNINAALGIPQLARIEELIDLKKKVSKVYMNKGLPVWLPDFSSDSRWNCWLIALELGPLDHRKDEICAALTADGIACRTMFTPLHLLPFYKNNPRDNLDGAMDIWRSIICIPSSPSLGEKL